MEPLLLPLLALRLTVSFLIGGTWVTLITWATVRYGTRLGGLLAAFPSTIAFSLVFIGWTQSVHAAVEATIALPLALGPTASFPLVYAAVAKKARFAVSLLAALGFWATCAVLFTEVALRTSLNFWLSVAGFYVFTLVAYLALAERRRSIIPSHGVRPTLVQWVWRFVLAGGVIVCAVYISQSVGPLVGGVFASFPAIITSTIFIVNRVEGLEASRSVAVPVTLTSLMAIVPYVITVRYAFGWFGVVAGTVTGYAVAIPLSLVAFYLLGRTRR